MPLAISRVRGLLRIAVVSATVSAGDAVAGRLLHAHPDPTPLLALLAGYWVTSTAVRTSVPATGAWLGGLAGILYLLAFVGWAALSSAVHWAEPWSASIGAFNWIVGAAVVGGCVGTRIRLRGAEHGARASAAPPI